MAFSVYPLSESLFYPCFLVFIYLLYKACSLNSTKYFSIAGLLLGITMLVKFNAAALFVSSFILFIVYLYKKEISFKNVLIFFGLAIVILLPWFLRNVLHFGFSLNGLLGRYVAEVPIIGGHHTFYSIFIWLLLYLSYSIIALGVFSLPIFLKGLLASKEKKFKLFLVIVSLAFLTFILMAAVHSGWFTNWKDSRPIGRYIEQSFPLIILGAFILVDRKIQMGFTRKGIILAVLFALLSYFLLNFKLYPLNNMSMALIGAFSYAGKWIAVICLILLACSFILVRKLNFRSFSYFLICFLLLGNLANFAMIYYSSQHDWFYRDEAVMGRWIDLNIAQDKVIGIPIEEHGFCKFGVSKSASILYSGMHFKNKIICIDGTSGYDYILSIHKPINGSLITSFGNISLYVGGIQTKG